MKYFLIVLFFTGVYAWADLPNNIQDPAMRESLEMLDTKAISVQKNTQAFTSTTSTSTIKGWLDVGVVLVTETCNSNTDCTATCPTGKKVLGGGGSCAPQYLDQSAPNAGLTAWSASCNQTTNVVAYAICAKVK